eukprot:766338-Hanusia_phi.AAC.3
MNPPARAEHRYLGTSDARWTKSDCKETCLSSSCPVRQTRGRREGTKSARDDPPPPLTAASICPLPDRNQGLVGSKFVRTTSASQSPCLEAPAPMLS